MRHIAEARQPLIYAGGGIVAGAGVGGAARVRRSPGHSGGPQPDGQGRPARRSSAGARHDRLLGHEARQRHVPRGRLGARPRHALQGSGLQLLVSQLHVQHSADAAHPHRHRAERDRPQLRHRDRRRRRPEASARGAAPGGARAVSVRRKPGRDRRADRNEPPRVRRRQQGDGDVRRIPDDAGAHPRRSARAAAARRDHHHRRRLEQERRRPAIPDLHARQRPDARRLRDDGLRSAGGDRREDRAPRAHRDFARRRRRLRPEPVGARDGGRAQARHRLARDEQQRLRHDRRPAEGRLRPDLRHAVPQSPKAAGASRSPTTRRSHAPTAAKASV